MSDSSLYMGNGSILDFESTANGRTRYAADCPNATPAMVHSVEI